MGAGRRRPLSRLVSWLFPAWQVAKVNRNLLYPDLQMEWDSGKHFAVLPLASSA